MNNVNWPNPVRGTNEPAVAWLNRLLAANRQMQLKDVIFSGGTAKILSSTDGQTLILQSDRVSKAQSYVYPFKIYNIANKDDPTKNNRTFQIRDGLVGFRPQYVYPFTNIAGIRALVANGNYEAGLYCVGTDNIGDFIGSYQPVLYNSIGNVDFSAPVSANAGGSVTLSQVDFTPYPVLICSSQVGATSPPGVQIVIEPNAGQSFSISFFINIVDDAAGAYSELWASVYDPGRSPAISNFAKTIPNKQQTIGIGIVTVDATGTATISQTQYGHLFNRYLEASPMPTGNATLEKFYGLPQVHRGKWSQNNLSGKIFYPGDEVINDLTTYAVTSSPLFSVNKAFTYIGTGGLGAVNIETTAPATGGPWLPTGLSPVS